MVAEARFWARVRKSEGCWVWTGHIMSRGYGRLRVCEKMVLAHRFAYQLTRGPIPDGLTLDHLCRVRHCVNPAHLEPTTNRENCLRGNGPAANLARQTHCKRGHPFDDANTYRSQRQPRRRVCRACKSADNARRAANARVGNSK